MVGEGGTTGAAGAGETGAVKPPPAGLLLPYCCRDGEVPNCVGFQTAPEPVCRGDFRSLGPVIGVSVLPAASSLVGVSL